MFKEHNELTAQNLIDIVGASGLVEEEPETPEQRARRATSSLIRSAKFGQEVVEAYDGLCAMCGLNLGIVVGAHVYPASAPASPDRVWNGVALCANHHTAFDKHLLFVEPGERHHSGLGMGGVKYSIEEMTQPKLVVLNV